jgi:predicted TPR repeat methyltransferase
MVEDKNHLDRAYGIDTVDATKAFYADWAATYDLEITKNGYATPERCAKAIATFADLNGAVLDVGCGTGLSGMALAKAGFSTIDGCDMTPEMLEGAQKLNLYRKLWTSDPNANLDMSNGPYNVIAAIGVIGLGAARMTLFHDIIKNMASKSFFVFSLNDLTLKDPSFEGAVMNAIDCGAFTLLFRETGDHFPARKMKSNVYVLQKR